MPELPGLRNKSLRLISILPASGRATAVVAPLAAALALLGGAAGARAQPPANVPRAAVDSSVVARVVASQQAAMSRLEQFCFRQQLLDEGLDDNGRVTRREQREELVCHRNGVPVYKQLVVNGRPTGNRETDPWPAIPDDENWRGQVRRATERRERFQEVIAEVPKAFDFTLLGQETVDGMPTNVYRLSPKPGYKATSAATEMLKHVTGRAWIDVESGHMVRLYAQVEDDFNMWGGLLLKVRKGATYELRQKPVNGVWLPWFAEERWHARIGLFKRQAQHKRVERAEFRPRSPSAVQK